MRIDYSLLCKKLKKAFIKDKTMANQKAVQKPATEKPGTMWAARRINSAFMTSEKIPSVKMVSGNVMSLTTGLIKIFMMPSTTAKMTALKSVTVAPGTKNVAIKMASVETKRCIMIFIPVL